MSASPLGPDLPIGLDLGTAFEFLNRITSRWGEICSGAQLEVAGISRARKVRSALFPATDEGISAAVSKARALNSEGFNIYYCVNPIGPDIRLRPGERPKDVHVAGAVFAFADGDQDEASRAMSADESASLHITTGTVPGLRLHTYWELTEPFIFQGVEGPAALAEWRAAMEGVIAAFGADKAVKNPSRLMRLPGFVSHAKDGSRVDEIVTWADNGKGAMPVSSIPRGGLPEPTLGVRGEDHSGRSPSSTSTPYQDRIDARLDASRIQGHWHANMLYATASLVAMGWSDAAIAEKCGPFCNHGATDPDLLTMINGARQKGFDRNVLSTPSALTTAAAPRRFELVRASELEFREPDYIVDGLIENDSLVEVFGNSGSGKSFFSLDIAACVATGRLFHGREVKRGAVIYVAGEGYNGLRRRLTAWEKHCQTSLEGAPLFISKASAQLLDTASAAAVTTAVDEIAAREGRPAMIIIDTLARNFGPGDENATRDMSAFVAAVDQLKGRYSCSALLIHHTGHSDKDRGRGSAALKAALDAEFRLERKDEKIDVIATKMKDAPMPPTLSFKFESVNLGIDKDGNPISSVVLVETEADEPRKIQKLSDNDLFGLKTFRQAAEKSCQLDSEGNFAGLHIEDWRTIFYAHSTADNPGTKRKSFNRARKDLVQKHELRVDNDLYWLVGPLAEFEHKQLSASLQARRNALIADLGGGIMELQAQTHSTTDQEQHAGHETLRDSGETIDLDPSCETGTQGQGSLDPVPVPVAVPAVGD